MIEPQSFKYSVEVSIVIPVYNSEKYIVQTINSVLNQTFPNFELLLIDDGSTDNSGKICDDFSSKYTCIRVIHSSNKGVSHARNIGIKQAIGHYIVFIDSDDTVECTFIEKLYKTISTKNINLVICALKRFYNDNRENYPVLLKEDDYINLTENIFCDFYALKSYMAYAATKMFDLQLIKKNNIYFPEDCTDAEDQIFVLRYIQYAHDYKFINEPLYNYRQTNEFSLSKLQTAQSFKSNFKAFLLLKEVGIKFHIVNIEKLLIGKAFFILQKYNKLKESTDSYSNARERTRMIFYEIKDFRRVAPLKRRIFLKILNLNIYFPAIFYYRIKNLLR